MIEKDDINLYPVVGWDMRFVATEQLVVIRLQFLSHLMQDVEQSHPGRNYAFQVGQLEDLRDSINRVLQKVSSGENTTQPQDLN